MTVREGDAVLQALCEAEHSRLVGMLTLYTGDPWLADELAQDALVRLCARWSEVQTKRNPGAWVTRVAINLANSSFRRRAAARRAAARHGATNATHTPSDVADALAVREAVAALPRKQREAIIHRYFSDLSVEETAVLMGLAPSSVRALTSRGITTLRTSGLVEQEVQA